VFPGRSGQGHLRTGTVSRGTFGDKGGDVDRILVGQAA
jgi:hypothetical protein